MTPPATSSRSSHPYAPPRASEPQRGRITQRTLIRGFLALLDQGFVSGARFVTSIVVGRYCGQEPLGFYSLGFSLLVLATCVQESLITAPYTVLHARRQAQGLTRYNGSVLLHVLMLSLLSTVAFGLSAIVLAQSGQDSLASVLGCLAIATPFALLREFARRLEFAQLRLQTSVMIDGVVATLQAGLLFALAWTGQLTAAVAFLATGIASMVGSLVWLWVVRRSFHFGWRQVGPDLAAGWRLGSWMFSAQLIGLVHLQGMYWVIAGWLSPAETGLFAACSTLVLFINPFALGLNNFIGPMAVHAAAQRGLAGVRRLIARAMAVMFCFLLAFTLCLFAGSDQLMSLIFDDPIYLGHAGLILMLGINMTFNSTHMVADNGLWAIERPQTIFWSSAVAVGVSLLLTCILVPQHKLMGAAISLTVSRIAAVAVEAAVFFFVIDESDVQHVRESADV